MCNREDLYASQSAVAVFADYVNAAESLKMNRFFNPQGLDAAIIKMFAMGILGMYTEHDAARLTLPICKTLKATFQTDAAVLCYLDDCCTVPSLRLDGLTYAEGEALKLKMKFYKVLIKQHLMLGHSA